MLTFETISVTGFTWAACRAGLNYCRRCDMLKLSAPDALTTFRSARGRGHAVAVDVMAQARKKPRRTRSPSSAEADIGALPVTGIRVHLSRPIDHRRGHDVQISNEILGVGV